MRRRHALLNELGALKSTVIETFAEVRFKDAAGKAVIPDGCDRVPAISHVPTVAERIATVLEVRHGIDGSTVAVLSVDEREQRVIDGAKEAAAAL